MSVGTRPAEASLDARQYGAKGDGITDDTVAINAAMTAALALGVGLSFPAGFTSTSGGATFKISGELAAVIGATQTLWIRGQGRDITTLFVANTFSLSNVGVFHITSAGGRWTDSGGIEDLTIKFQQPDSVLPSDMIHYPPAVFVTGTNHYTIRRVNIAAAYDAISAVTLNGLHVEDVGMSFFHFGITIDKCFDSTDLIGVVIWPFGLTVNQATAFLDLSNHNIGFYLGHCDALVIDRAVTLCNGYTMDFHVGADSLGSTGFVTNCWFDGVGNITISSGSLKFSGIHQGVTANFAGISGIHISGGSPDVRVEGLNQIFAGGAPDGVKYLPNADNVTTPAGGLGGLSITNWRANIGVENCAALTAQAQTGVTKNLRCKITRLTILKDPAAAFTVPFIRQLAPVTAGSVRVHLVDIDVSTKAAGSGTAVSLATDDSHIVSVGDFGGYARSIAGTTNTKWDTATTTNYT